MQTILREEREACWGTDESEEHILGVIIANHFGWDGVRVLETAAEALEDANFHGECELVRKMITNIKQGFIHQPIHHAKRQGDSIGETQISDRHD